MGSRDEYIGSIKSAFVSIQLRVTLTLLAALPYVGWFFRSSFGSWLAEYFLRKLFTKTADNSEIAAFFKYIDMRVGKQSDAFEAAAYAHQTALKFGDKNAIKKAEDYLFSTFANFVRFTS